MALQPLTIPRRATAPTDIVPAAIVPAQGRPVASVRDVYRRFGDRTVLRGVSLALAQGEFVALLGRSGSGKTTLLRALAGLDTDVEGRIDVTPERAVVFQDARLLPWLRVLDNVVLGRRGATARTAGRAALHEVGLSGHDRDWPKTLSGGEAQRVALARALVRRPQLLLLDEPFGALDALTRIKMHRLLQQLCRMHEPAVLLVTHDVDEAILLADRVLVLTDGRITLDEPVAVGAPRHRPDPSFLMLRERLLAELGVIDDTDPQPGDSAPRHPGPRHPGPRHPGPRHPGPEGTA